MATSLLLNVIHVSDRAVTSAACSTTCDTLRLEQLNSSCNNRVMTTSTGVDTDRSTTTRKSLPLNERDLADLARLRGSAAHKSALRSLAYGEKDSSESAILHALVRIGLQRVEDQVAEASYAAEAKEQRATRDRRQAAARTRRSRVRGAE